MRGLFSVAVCVLISSPSLADNCYQQLESGDTMQEVMQLCGEPTHRKDLGSDMTVRGNGTGKAKILSIEHSRTETLWVYENDEELYLRFENGLLVERERVAQ